MTDVFQIWQHHLNTRSILEYLERMGSTSGWRAYNKSGEPNPRDFPVIPAVRDYEALEGSNEIYHWRSRSDYLPQLEALFVSCYCVICRSGNHASCKYRHVTHSLVAGYGAKIFTTHECALGGGAGAAESDEDSD